MKKEIALKAGLVEAGKDEDGNQLYMGTDKQWEEAERLQDLADHKDDPVYSAGWLARHDPDEYEKRKNEYYDAPEATEEDIDPENLKYYDKRMTMDRAKKILQGKNN